MSTGDKKTKQQRRDRQTKMPSANQRRNKKPKPETYQMEDTRKHWRRKQGGKMGVGRQTRRMMEQDGRNWQGLDGEQRLYTQTHYWGGQEQSEWGGKWTEKHDMTHEGLFLNKSENTRTTRHWSLTFSHVWLIKPTAHSVADRADCELYFPGKHTNFFCSHSPSYSACCCPSWGHSSFGASCTYISTLRDQPYWEH